MEMIEIGLGSSVSDSFLDCWHEQHFVVTRLTEGSLDARHFIGMIQGADTRLGGFHSNVKPGVVESVTGNAKRAAW